MHIQNFMTSSLKNNQFSFFLILAFLFVAFSCEKNKDDVGINILNPDDFLSQDTVSVQDFALKTNVTDYTLSVETSTLFGQVKTQAGVLKVEQFMPFFSRSFYSSIRSFELDSVTFEFLDAGYIYGDLSTPLNLILSIVDSLPDEQYFLENKHPGYFSDAKKVASFSILPTIKNDTFRVKKYQITLPSDVGEYIFNSLKESTELPLDTKDNSGTLSRHIDSLFLKKFPGLIIDIPEDQQDAFVMQMIMPSILFYVKNLSGENDTLVLPTIDKPIIGIENEKIVTYFYQTPIPEYSFQIDENVKQSIEQGVDTIGYVQGMKGFSTELICENLNIWLSQDMHDVAVNYAELAVPINTDDSVEFPRPNYLMLNVYEKDGDDFVNINYYVSDTYDYDKNPLTFESSYYVNSKYVFDFTRFLNYFIQKGVPMENYKIEIVPYGGNGRISSVEVLNNKNLFIKAYYTLF